MPRLQGWCQELSGPSVTQPDQLATDKENDAHLMGVLNPGTQGLQQMMAELCQEAHLDNMDLSANTTPLGRISVTLIDLFDFQNAH